MIQLPYNIIISFDLIFLCNMWTKKEKKREKIITNQIVIDG